MKNVKIIIISDATGATAKAIARAVLVQFKDGHAYFTNYKNVRSKKRIDAIFEEAATVHDIVIYTIVSAQLREYIADLSRKKHIRSIDLMGPALTAFSNFFDKGPLGHPGLLHQVNDDYFQRVSAMEFALNHDDGKNLDSLHLADVVLVGISRTSKTPLSMFLSLHGIKAVNVPIVPQIPLAQKIFEIDQRKIVGLTINPEALKEIRKKRLARLGAQRHSGDYANDSKVAQEVEWANRIFKENKTWPVFDVTDKAIEETASDIIRILNLRGRFYN